MTYTTRTFIDALGGYKKVAKLIDKGPTTVHTAVQSKVFPSAWYNGFCELARKNDLPEPSRDLFSFLALPPQRDVSEVCHE